MGITRFCYLFTRTLHRQCRIFILIFFNFLIISEIKNLATHQSNKNDPQLFRIKGRKAPQLLDD